MSEVLLYENPNVFSVDATSKTLYFILPYIISKSKKRRRKRNSTRKN